MTTATKSPTTLIGIQDEYIATVVAGAERWSHRKPRGFVSCETAFRCGGHFSRICRGAHTKAFAALTRLGFSKEAAEAAIAQAYNMAKLEMTAEG